MSGLSTDRRVSGGAVPNTDPATNKPSGFARLPQVSASGRAGEAGGASPVPGGAAPPIPHSRKECAGQPASEDRGIDSLAGARLCKGCKVALAYKLGEGRAHFRKRQYCGLACANFRRPKPPRHCPVCKTVLVRRDGEDPKRFNARKTCGVRACADKLRARPHAKRKRNDAEFDPSYHLHWPEITGDIDFNGGFGRHNVTELRVIGRNPIPSPSRSLTGCSAVLAYRGGGA